MDKQRRGNSPRRQTERRFADRRTDERCPSGVGIRFLRAGSPGDQVLHGQLLDASNFGICILLDEPPGDSAALLVEVRDQHRHCFSLTVDVVWTETTDEGLFRVGCELRVELTNRQRLLLEQIAGNGSQSADESATLPC